MAQDNNDFLRFSAYSIKELITRKLTSDTKFTDQVYEGSNLAILIDIVSYMYQCLIYNLNKSAAEAMFSDTQIYENINRLCKFIGYNPKGCSPATVEFVLENSGDVDDDGNGIFWSASIPKYSYIDTGKTDDNGKTIYYSTASLTTVPKQESNFSVLFYNGIWKMYPTIYTGSGQPYQTLYLDEIGSDTDNIQFVASNYIDVYILEDGKYKQWSRTDYGVFADDKLNNGTPIYGNSERIYSVRLNENKTYEISFGSGSIGKAPPKDASIIIMYLDTNGPSGAIDAGAVTDGRIAHSAASFGMDDNTYTLIFGAKTDQFSELEDNGVWKNISNSSTFQEEETVDDIKRNAPEWFKTGNRLVTVSDWEYFVRNQFKDNILDVVCQNNWAYMTSFYRWLYNLGIKDHDAKKYLNQSKLAKYVKYSDAADSNNIYLWIKMKNNAEIYSDIINSKVQNIKMLTQQPVYLNPLDVYFAISAEDAETAKAKYFANEQGISFEFDPNHKSYLEVTIDDDILYSNVDLKTQIKDIILNFFDENSQSLGETVNGSTLLDQILALRTVSRVRTVYHDDETGEEQIYSGISFATWTSGFIDVGDDLEISTGARTLEVFQFPKLYNESDIENNIKIIKKSVGNINTIQY